jgi:hypothetical protein
LAGDGVQGVITPRLIYATLRLSGLAVESGKGDVMAFVDVQGDAIANVYKALVTDLNRQCWGDGTGLLATSSAAATPSTSVAWTVTFNNDTGVRYLRKGMIVDFYQSTTQDATASSVRISAVNPSARTASFEAIGAGTNYRSNHPTTAAQSYTQTVASIASGSYLVRQGARAATHVVTTRYELDGLGAAYDDGDALSVYEGITIASDPEFKANVLDNSAVNREVSIDLMLLAMDTTSTRSDETVSLIRTGLGQRRKYFGLLANDVRYAPGDFLGGYERLRFAQNAQVSMIFDPVTPPNKMFFEPTGCIKKYELTPIGWGGMDDQKMHWRENYDQATMFLRLYTNIGVEKRNALTLLADLVEPTSNVW